MRYRQLAFFTLFVSVALMSACSGEGNLPPPQSGDDAAGFSPPSAATVSINRQLAQQLPLHDARDFDDARRGLIAAPQQLVISGPGGEPAWNMQDYAFITGEAPGTVNPSLWRQETLNNLQGLFEVAPDIYQIRGFDLANMTLIRGDAGWIVVDPLTNAQTADAAMRFAFAHLPAAPVTAVLFTHSHIDHFGGVLGALQAAATDVGSVQVVAPEGFLAEATSENILAGPAMGRRADFMYGSNLPRSVRAHVGSGLGKAPSPGNIGILPPTEVIRESGQRLMIDGVEFEFQIVSGSEAPAEFTFYLPRQKVFCGAELVSHTLHNLYTLRGAKVRDALAWSGFIDDAIERFGEAEVYFGSHHWPVWGRERIREFLEVQRDTYKFLHDQTVRWANLGYTPREIAERIRLPSALQRSFHNRDYYGTVSHNSKAVYQYYFGWYDGNPAHLNPLPPVEESRRYVAAMGGGDAVLALGKQAVDEGEYRWGATLLNHLVFAEPENTDAAALLARCYDQLGYQAESGPWRDAYLTGAFELRHGKPDRGLDLAMARDMIRHAERSHFFAAMAAQVKAEEAEDAELTVNFYFTDLDENHVLHLKNAVLHHRMRPRDDNADVTINVTHDLFIEMALGTVSVRELVFSDELDIDGSRLALVQFFALVGSSDEAFSIVRPGAD